MKQLIVLAAVLPLMLIFMAQFTLEQRNSAVINALQQQVYTAKEEAKQQGCFTPSIIEQLRKDINMKLGVPEQDIIIIATETPQYRINYSIRQRKGDIHYSVSVPIEKNSGRR